MTKQEAFMKAIIDTAQQVLDQGQLMQYGSASLEIRFEAGVPVMLVRGYTDATKYPDNETAIDKVAETLHERIDSGYVGSKTFTVVFDKRGINRILGDNYQIVDS